MDCFLRPYAYVRNRLEHMRTKRSRTVRLIVDIPALPARTAPLEPRLPPCMPNQTADLVIRNARLPLEDPKAEHPVDIAVAGGRIIFVGRNFTGPTHEKIQYVDAHGCSVLPGLTDAHVHLPIGAERRRGCDVEEVKTPSDFKNRLIRFMDENPDQDVYYAYGLHYLDPPLLPPSTARSVLDEIVKDKPLLVFAHDLHTAWANTRALELAGLMQPMPPYPELVDELNVEGNLILDKNGLPGGELREPPVYFLVDEALRRHFPLHVEEKKELLRQTCCDLAAMGLTCVHTMGLDLPEEDIEYLLLLLELELENKLPLRVYVSCSVVPDEMMLKDVERAARIRDALDEARQGRMDFARLHGKLVQAMQDALAMRQEEKRVRADRPQAIWNRFTSLFSHVVTEAHLAQHARKNEKLSAQKGKVDPMGMVRCQAVKLFMDGVVEKDTAFRLDHHPLPGIPAFSQAELDRVVQTADRAGLQVAAHCIGNGAVNAMLNAVEQVRKENRDTDHKRGHMVRHRIEHIELCNAYDIPRFGPLEVVASMQPLHQRMPPTLWHEKIPENQWATAFAWQSLRASGACLVFGSDWPIVSCNCLKGMQRAVSRGPWKPGLPDEHLDRTACLHAFSTAAAYTEHCEKSRGRIQTGMPADLVVLSHDVLKFQGDLENISVTHTICRGRVTYPHDEG